MIEQVLGLFGVFSNEMFVHCHCFSSANRDIGIAVGVPNKGNKLGTEVKMANLDVIVVRIQLISSVVPLPDLVVESVLGGVVVGPVDFVDVLVIRHNKGDRVVSPVVVVLNVEVVEVLDGGVEGVVGVVLGRIEIREPVDHPRSAHNIHIPVKHPHLLDRQLRDIECFLVDGSHQNRGGVLQLEHFNEGVFLLDARFMIPFAES